MNFDHLRRALAVPPVGQVPPKPTSVPTVITLEEILTRAHNKFRSPPKASTFVERVRDFIKNKIRQ